MMFLGDNITGTLNFGGYGTTNFFDPVNGGVPGGSSGIQPAAIVADPDPSYVEFMYINGANGLDVDVDDTTISLLEYPIGTPDLLNSWDVWINDLDLAGGGVITGYSLLGSNFGSALSISTTLNSVHFSSNSCSFSVLVNTR